MLQEILEKNKCNLEALKQNKIKKITYEEYKQLPIEIKKSYKEKILNLAAYSNNTDILKDIRQYFIIKNFYRRSIEKSDIEEACKQAIYIAIDLNNIDALEILIEEYGLDFQSDYVFMLSNATKKGKEEIFMYLAFDCDFLSYDSEVIQSVIIKTIENHNIFLLQWLISNNYVPLNIIDKKILLGTAIRSNNFDIFKYLVEDLGFPIEEYIEDFTFDIIYQERISFLRYIMDKKKITINFFKKILELINISSAVAWFFIERGIWSDCFNSVVDKKFIKKYRRKILQNDTVSSLLLGKVEDQEALKELQTILLQKKKKVTWVIKDLL